MTPSVSDHTLDVLEYGAVLSMLADRAVSAMGREQVLGIRPETDAGAIRKRMDTVTEIRRALEKDLPFPLRGIRDIRPALDRARVSGALLEPETFLDVLYTLQASRELHSAGRRIKREQPSPRIEAITENLVVFTEIEEEIQRAIDRDGSVKDQASPQLGRIRREHQVARDRVREHLNRFVQSDDGRQTLQEPVVTIRDGRYVVPVRIDQRARVRGVVHDQSASGATIFIEPLSVVDLNNRLRELTLEERREIDRILTRLTALIHERLDEIVLSVELMGSLDCFHAAALLSLDLNAAPPRLNDQGRLALYNARHPALVLAPETASPGSVVPLTLEMFEDVFTLVITGPNMGGKTVALKTVGLLTLMAQAGLHIPADSHSEISLFTRIYADIGDEQSIQASLSTFSSHLRQIVDILNEADHHALVLLDELGSGTDPAAGAALGIAILEELTARRTTTVATTHHGALKAFATNTEGVINGSMAFDVERLRPTYRFQQGIPGSSYAIEIGERLGLSRNILLRAETLMGAEEQSLDRLILTLDRERETLRSTVLETERMRADLEKLKQDYEKRMETLERQERALKEKALEEADRILRAARATVEKTVASIRAGQASANVVKQAEQHLEDRRSQLRALMEPAATPAPEPAQAGGEIHTGDRVWVSTLKRSVLVLADLGERLQVQAGNLEFTVRREDARLEKSASEKTGKASRPKGRVRVNVTMEKTPPELNIHGFRAEEALEAVDRYLDQAVLDGYDRVRILHGKGTGVLSRSVRELLEHHDLVQSFRFAPPAEGGTGVTIVELGV